MATVVPIRTSPMLPVGTGSPGCKSENLANALHRRIPVGGTVVGKHLRAMQDTAGSLADDIGKGAAPIDPEIPKLIVHGFISTHFAAAVIRRVDLSMFGLHAGPEYASQQIYL